MEPNVVQGRFGYAGFACDLWYRPAFHSELKCFEYFGLSDLFESYPVHFYIFRRHTKLNPPDSKLGR